MTRDQHVQRGRTEHGDVRSQTEPGGARIKPPTSGLKEHLSQQENIFWLRLILREVEHKHPPGVMEELIRTET